MTTIPISKNTSRDNFSHPLRGVSSFEIADQPRLGRSLMVSSCVTDKDTAAARLFPPDSRGKMGTATGCAEAGTFCEIFQLRAKRLAVALSRHMVFAFTGAERETSDTTSGRLGAGFSQEGQQAFRGGKVRRLLDIRIRVVVVGWSDENFY
jgi:hypothetical protein